MTSEEKQPGIYSGHILLIILMGALTAFAPFVTDMYLPALPRMVSQFHASESLVQLTLTACMIGLALGQLLFGSLSDRFGRRPVLIVSLSVFIVACALCLIPAGIGVFIMWRFMQGLSAAGSVVIARSIATDYYTGNALAKIMGAVGAVNGLAPILAPVIGGALAETLGWTSVFWVLLALGILLCICCICMKESLPPHMRAKDGVITMGRYFVPLFRNRRYMGYMLQLGLAQGVLFVNIASSPFIIQNHFGFGTFQFSLIFALNAFVLTLFAFLGSKFRNVETGTLTGGLLLLGFAIVQFIALYYGRSFLLYEIMVAGLMAGMGICFTTSTTLAMEAGRENSGTASALLGATGFTIGGVVSPLCGLGNPLHSTAIMFLLCALLSMGAILLARKK